MTAKPLKGNGARLRPRLGTGAGASLAVLAKPPGVRYRGTNVIPAFTDATSTDQNDAFAAMWRVWNWNGWIKPQLDDSAAVGNVVRIFGSPMAIALGNITQATYLARWKQFLDYCVYKGLYAYPCGGDLGHWGGMSDANAVSLYGAWAAMLAPYQANIIGIDIVNEAIGSGTNDAAMVTKLASFRSAIKSNCNIPVTFSMPLTDVNWWTWDGGTTFPLAALFNLSDFLDYHVYTPSTPAQASAAFSTPWGSGKYAIMGEFGCNETLSGSDRTAVYQQAADITNNDPRWKGALCWACYDLYSTTDWQYGLYSAPGTLRTDISTPYLTIPISH